VRVSGQDDRVSSLPDPSGPVEEAAAPRGVQSVDRALGLLRAVADTAPRGATLAELAAACDLNRATAWRLLGSLESHGLVERDPDSHRYRVGLAVLRMSAAAGYDGLVRRCHPVLERVCAETGETADLAVTGARGVTYVGEVAPVSVLAVNWLAREVPLHATSTGLAFLAWLPEEEARELLRGPLRRYTDTTLTDPEDVVRVLRETRERGWAACAGELEPTLHGVSAPVLTAQQERPVAVFSIWGPVDRVPRSRFPELGRRAVEAAAEIAAVMAGGSA
jgi:DNA-binding IclR family transcriptional regulator